MPSFSPTILVTTPPLLITMSGGITYEEFTFMLGVLNLQVEQFFIESQSNQQVDANLQYNILDSSGLQQQYTLKPRRDPYQKQSSLYLVPEKGSVLLNGLSILAFNLLPSEIVSFTLCVEQSDPTTFSPGTLPDNFAADADTLGNYRRFKQQTCT